jgi:hypothetical protein
MRERKDREMEGKGGGGQGFTVSESGFMSNVTVVFEHTSLAGELVCYVWE